MKYHNKVFLETDIHIPALVLTEYDRLTEAACPVISHTHHDCIEILVLFKGAQRYETESGVYSIRGGEAFVARAGERHGHKESQAISEYIRLHIDMRERSGFLGLAGISAEQVYRLLQNNREHVLSANAKCISLLRESFSSIEKGMYICAQGFFICFLYLLFSSGNKNEPDLHKLERVVSCMRERVCDNISLEEICAGCAISLSGLKHKFKEYTGETPRAYINRMKIEEAKKLLRQEKNVMEVSMALSFSSSSYFSTVFKKHTRKTPREYAKRFRAANEEEQEF